jgi:hypothetical protein
MPAAARARTHAQRRAARTAPHHHRRVSGPMRPAVAAPRVAPPQSRQRTSAFERLGRLPDHRLVDGLLRSRAWIVVVAVLLGGIVAMQVSLLKLNAGITRAVEASATLERQNADMEDSIARLNSGARVRDAAVAKGMVAPPAGDVGFLRSRGARDAQLAAARMQPPSAAARALMAAGGHAPGAAVATTSTGTTATVPTPAPTPTPTPSTALTSSSQTGAATATGQG